MSRQFYAHEQDEQRCRHSAATQKPITITGLTLDGKAGVFTGTVDSVEKGHTAYPKHPLRVTMPDSE